MSADGCGAPAGGVPIPAGVDLSSQAVVQGRVVRGAAEAPVSPASARRLDASGGLAGGRATDEEGVFRFFAARATGPYACWRPAARSPSARYARRWARSPS